MSPQNESSNGHTHRLDELESNDGRIATELAVLNTKFDAMKESLERIENLLEERPSKVEFIYQQRQIDSLRAKEHSPTQVTLMHYARIGGLTVGAIGLLEVWLKVHSVVAPLLGL